MNVGDACGSEHEVGATGAVRSREGDERSGLVIRARHQNSSASKQGKSTLRDKAWGTVARMLIAKPLSRSTFQRGWGDAVGATAPSLDESARAVSCILTRGSELESSLGTWYAKKKKKNHLTHGMMPPQRALKVLSECLTPVTVVPSRRGLNQAQVVKLVGCRCILVWRFWKGPCQVTLQGTRHRVADTAWSGEGATIVAAGGCWFTLGDGRAARLADRVSDRSASTRAGGLLLFFDVRCLARA